MVSMEELKHGNLQILRMEWINGNVGIIFCKDMITNEIKVFIGKVDSGSRNTEVEDAKYIIDWGTKFSGEYAEGYFAGLASYVHELNKSNSEDKSAIELTY